MKIGSRDFPAPRAQIRVDSFNPCFKQLRSHSRNRADAHEFDITIAAFVVKHLQGSPPSLALMRIICLSKSKPSIRRHSQPRTVEATIAAIKVRTTPILYYSVQLRAIATARDETRAQLSCRSNEMAQSNEILRTSTCPIIEADISTCLKFRTRRHCNITICRDQLVFG